MIKKIKRSDYEGVRTSLQELAKSNNWHLSFVSCFDNGIRGQARTGYDTPYEVVVVAPDAKQYGLLHKVDMKDVTNVIINSQHEFRHLVQRQELQTSNKFDFMAVPFIAKYNNGEYYATNGRYYTDLSELDAEYNGIIAGYQYISEHFGEDTADHYVFEYIKTRCKNDYFIDDNFETIDEALDKFDEKIKTVMKQRPSSDYFPRFHKTDAISKAAYANPQIMDKLMSLNSDERDRLVAAVNLYQNVHMKDAYYQTDLPDLQDFGINTDEMIMEKNDVLPYGTRNTDDIFDGNMSAADDQQYEVRR